MAQRERDRKRNDPRGIQQSAPKPAPQPLLPPEPVGTVPLAVGLVVIVAAAVGAYWPTLSATYISWDDPDYVRDNLMLHDNNGLPDAHGLGQIWNPYPKDDKHPAGPDGQSGYKHQQYYPLVFTTFWIEYYLTHPVKKPGGGLFSHPVLPPGGNFREHINYSVFHRTNLAMHLVNIGLALWLLRRLGLSQWVALGAAAIFALHPVQVASIAWLSERKNVLSGIFYLLAFILYLRHRRLAAETDSIAGESTRLFLVQIAAYLPLGIIWLICKRANANPDWVVLGGVLTLALLVPMVVLMLHANRMKGWGAYAGCMAAFACAMFSKTQSLTLFLALMLADWLLQSNRRLPRLSPRGVLARVLPMMMIGLGMSQITARIEHGNGPSGNPTQVVYQPYEQPIISTLPQRWIAIAPTAGWFYVGKLLAPLNLAPVYERWRIDLTHPKWYAGLLAWPVAIGLAFAFRRKLGGYVLFGAANFLILLSPALGLAPFNYQQYSFVADHFLYLPCLFGGLVVAVLFERVAGSGAGALGRRSAVAALGGALLVGCGCKTYVEAGYWKDLESFWLRAIACNPDCYPAYRNLGNHYVREGMGKRDDALLAKSIPLYEQACALQPRGVWHFQQLISVIQAVGGPDMHQRIIKECGKRINDYPAFYPAMLTRGNSQAALGKRDAACEDFAAAMRATPPGSPPWNEANAARTRLNCPPPQMQLP